MPCKKIHVAQANDKEPSFSTSLNDSSWKVVWLYVFWMTSHHSTVNMCAYHLCTGRVSEIVSECLQKCMLFFFVIDIIDWCRPSVWNNLGIYSQMHEYVCPWTDLLLFTQEQNQGLCKVCESSLTLFNLRYIKVDP